MNATVDIDENGREEVKLGDGTATQRPIDISRSQHSIPGSMTFSLRPPVGGTLCFLSGYDAGALSTRTNTRSGEAQSLSITYM